MMKLNRCRGVDCFLAFVFAKVQGDLVIALGHHHEGFLIHVVGFFRFVVRRWWDTYKLYETSHWNQITQQGAPLHYLLANKYNCEVVESLLEARGGFAILG